MLRIIDLPGALTGRGYNPTVEAELGFTIDDLDAPWNTGSWTLTVAGGTATVRRESDDPTPRSDRPAIAMPTLSAIYSGYLNPVALQRSGGLPGANPTMAARLAGVFAGPPPRMVDHF